MYHARDNLETFIGGAGGAESFLKMIEEAIDNPPLSENFNTESKDKRSISHSDMGWSLLVSLSDGVAKEDVEEILCGKEQGSPRQEKMRQIIRTHQAFK